MKIGGKRLSAPTETVVIPRKTGDIIFKIQGIISFDEFDKLVKEPVPPTIKRPGKPDSADRKDEGFVKAWEEYAKQRSAYIIIASLVPTEDLEWEELTLDDPSTWHLWQKELQDAGFTEYEINHLASEIMAVNGLGEDRYKDAKSNFLASHPPSPVSQ